MKNIDCHDEMLSYHRERVNLSNGDQKEMHDRRDSGRTRLATGLTEDGHPLPKIIASQGSYAMKTMVQDAKSEYDIDDGVYFPKSDLVDAQGAELTPKAARQRVRNALKHDDRLKHDAEVKNNCVRQIYPQGYHIDVPVYRIINSEDGDKYELASADSWVESDARAVTKWFADAVKAELKRGEIDSSQLRKITKLTKKMARSRDDWKEKTTSGICLSKLVVDQFVNCLNRDDVALRKTWNAINSALDKSLQIIHPVLEGKYLAEDGDSKVKFFHKRLKEQLTELETLDQDGCTKKKALDTWDKVFNTSYFSNQYDEKDDEYQQSLQSQSPFVVTNGDAAKRDDKGKPFG